MTTVEPIVELLRNNGHRMTQQRAVIVEIVMRTKGHITPPELLRRAQEKLPGVNGSTVYRTLALLEEIGVLSHAHLEGGPEYHHVAAHDHVHLACGSCGRDHFLHVDDAGELTLVLEKKMGFRADFSHFAIAGTCRECVEKSRQA